MATTIKWRSIWPKCRVGIVSVRHHALLARAWHDQTCSNYLYLGSTKTKRGFHTQIWLEETNLVGMSPQFIDGASSIEHAIGNVIRACQRHYKKQKHRVPNTTNEARKPNCLLCVSCWFKMNSVVCVSTHLPLSLSLSLSLFLSLESDSKSESERVCTHTHTRTPRERATSVMHERGSIRQLSPSASPLRSVL